MSCARTTPPTLDDSDVVTGFPVKRFTLMLLFANMMAIGGAFIATMASGIYFVAYMTKAGGYGAWGGSSYSTGIFQFFALFGEGIEGLWTFATDDLSQTAHFLFLASIPGTIGGIVWYLILRWRERLILKKRLQALRNQQRQFLQVVNADTAPTNSANPALH
jgi:hypothetical protein